MFGDRVEPYLDSTRYKERTMPGRTKANAMVALVMMAAIGAANTPAAHAVERPFHLVEHGTATIDGANVTSSGSGVATHLGRFTLERTATLSNPQGSVLDVEGNATLTSASGDLLHASITGSLDTATSRGVLLYEWEGGTGRFDDATGTTTWYVQINPDQTYDVVAHGVIDF
jgi:hypothetical protein